MQTPSRTWVIFLQPIALACAPLLAFILLRHAPTRIATDLAQPLVVATNWHDFGRTLWTITFVCLLTAFIPYYLVLQALLRGTICIRLRSVVLLSALGVGACLCMPVIFSSDVYAYAAYGWMAAHGISPYAHLALTTHAPLMTAAFWQWSNPLPMCVYGPLFVWIAKLCVIAGAPFGTAGQLMLLRLLSGCALVLCAPLVYAAMRDYKPEQRSIAAVGIALNPLALWVAAEGHNDTIVLAMVLLGFIAIRKFGHFGAAFVIASAALIKATSIAAAGMLALYAWHDFKRFIRVLAGIACGVTLTAVVARPFEEGVRGVLVPHGHYAPQFSPQFAVAQVLQSSFGARAPSLEIGIAVVLVFAGAVALYGARRILKDERDGVAWIAFALWLAIPNPYPWYALWILPAAFLCTPKPAAWAIIAASASIFLRYFPDVSTNTHVDLNLAITSATFGIPLMVLLYNRGLVVSRTFELDSPT